ncbi:MAG: TAXI family TRAP transporter solute-binding subunit [Bdellovibrionota bacterium]|nr:TAXI family TRAP transporter solute-binding subunit [Bdellovibrionota bacterium]
MKLTPALCLILSLAFGSVGVDSAFAAKKTKSTKTQKKKSKKKTQAYVRPKSNNSNRQQTNNWGTGNGWNAQENDRKKREREQKERERKRLAAQEKKRQQERAAQAAKLREQERERQKRDQERARQQAKVEPKKQQVPASQKPKTDPKKPQTQVTQKPAVNPRDNSGKQTGNSWGNQGTTKNDRSQKGWNQKAKTNGLFQRTQATQHAAAERKKQLSENPYKMKEEAIPANATANYRKNAEKRNQEIRDARKKFDANRKAQLMAKHGDKLKSKQKAPDGKTTVRYYSRNTIYRPSTRGYTYYSYDGYDALPYSPTYGLYYSRYGHYNPGYQFNMSSRAAYSYLLINSYGIDAIQKVMMILASSGLTKQSFMENQAMDPSFVDQVVDSHFISRNTFLSVLDRYQEYPDNTRGLNRNDFFRVPSQQTVSAAQFPHEKYQWKLWKGGACKINYGGFLFVDSYSSYNPKLVYVSTSAFSMPSFGYPECPTGTEISSYSVNQLYDYSRMYNTNMRQSVAQSNEQYTEDMGYDTEVNVQDGALNICTGSISGTYEYVSSLIADSNDTLGNMNMSTVQSAGSIENLQLLTQGACNLAIVQKDALDEFNSTDHGYELEQTSPIYKEYAHLICNSNSRVSKLRDLNQRTKIAIGPENSGSDLTFNKLSEMQSDLKMAKPLNMSYETAMKALVGDDSVDEKVDCVFTVSSLGSELTWEINQISQAMGRQKLEFIELNSSDFEDADDEYEFLTVDKGEYPSIYFEDDKLTTVAVDALLVYVDDKSVENSLPAVSNLSESKLRSEIEDAAETFHEDFGVKLSIGAEGESGDSEGIFGSFF